jgi:hypothetical protein
MKGGIVEDVLIGLTESLIEIGEVIDRIDEAIASEWVTGNSMRSLQREKALLRVTYQLGLNNLCYQLACSQL